MRKPRPQVTGRPFHGASSQTLLCDVVHEALLIHAVWFGTVCLSPVSGVKLKVLVEFTRTLFHAQWAYRYVILTIHANLADFLRLSETDQDKLRLCCRYLWKNLPIEEIVVFAGITADLVRCSGEKKVTVYTHVPSIFWRTAVNTISV